MDPVEDLASAWRRRRNSETAARATAAGLIVRVILSATRWLPSDYRWPVAVAVAVVVFVALGVLDTRYLLTRRRGRHEKSSHRR